MRDTSDNSLCLLFVVGTSGAGKSSALRFFDDIGFYPIENLPLALLPQFTTLISKDAKRYERTAISPDIDSKDKVSEFLNYLRQAQNKKQSISVIFLDCSTPDLIKRYSETRRPHPTFKPRRDQTIEDAIKREREILTPIKEIAQVVIDTSGLSLHQLRRSLKAFASTLAEKSPSLTRVNFVSFGFKYGIPLDCDLLIDVRFLSNPHFIDELRPKNGTDAEVANYVLDTASAQEFLKRYSELLQFLLPHYIFEGKSYLNIAIGCTGGKHRSVAIAEKLSKMISHRDCLVSVKHRDISLAQD